MSEEQKYNREVKIKNGEGKNLFETYEVNGRTYTDNLGINAMISIPKKQYIEYEQQKEEIEKLKEQNKMLKEAVKEKVIATCNACEDYGICPHSYREFDLDNIINELEKYINEEYIYDELGMKIFDASELQDKLQELKGVDKE